MRLINVDTFQLEEFMDSRSILYAILSHTWGKGEVTFADIQRGLPHAQKLPGFEKIRGACRQANWDGFPYVWVDTCCIDKSSSAELSEAINSMFRLYSNAGICYTYLSDVTEVGDGPEAESQFRNSRWFTRGWTLQELLAPKKVVFYSRDWTKIGTKKKSSRTIAEITGIDPKALGTLDITKFSVAERMSWASGRVTTRQEDIAYCLLGIFGVNMSLLYGEGERAFIRLEEEIIKITDDHSIFAWTSSSDAVHKAGGLLATSPSQFKHSRGIIRYDGGTGTSRPYLMTNKGLSIKMDVLRGDAPQEFFALLDCRTRGGSDLAICLRESITSRKHFRRRFAPIETAAGDQFTRVRNDELYAIQPRTDRGTAEFFVRQTSNVFDPVDNTRGTMAFMLDDISPSFKLDRVMQYPLSNHIRRSKNVKLVCVYGHGGGVLVNISKGVNDWVATVIFKSIATEVEVWVMLGWTDGFGVSVHICEGYQEDSDEDIIEEDLVPLDKCIKKREISQRYETPEGELNTESILASVSVDTQHQDYTGALYEVLYKVTLDDERYEYVAADSEAESGIH